MNCSINVNCPRIFKKVSRKTNVRSGKILVITALVLTVVLGMAALAVDIGIIAMTRTQLQAASDSGSLAAGSQLLSGLGAGAYRTPTQVVTVGQQQAQAFVAFHPAAEVASLSIEPTRDTQFGKASLNVKTGSWNFTWGSTPYNAVSVTTLRSSTGTSASDGPLPLVFARALGRNTANVTAESVAVIMPASGIRILPGTGLSSGLSPFAFAQERWLKYWRARDYFVSHGFTEANLTQSANGHLITDPSDLDGLGQPRPLFYEKLVIGNRVTYRRLFGDLYSYIDADRQDDKNIVQSPDGILEMNIYPINSSAGNFGTVNIGNDSNSTAVLGDQIENGLSEKYLAGYAGNQINPTADNPLILEGDTGISAGIEASLEEIIGQTRSIVLYSTVQNPGNTAKYTIVDMAGIRFMSVDLHGNLKTLIIQPESVSDAAGIPDYDEVIGTTTSFFTPLILAR